MDPCPIDSQMVLRCSPLPLDTRLAIIVFSYPEGQGQFVMCAFPIALLNVQESELLNLRLQWEADAWLEGLL